MSWNVTLDYAGKRASYNTDQLTLDEIEDVERVSGTAWALSNPLASIQQAKGYLVVFALRDGMTEDQIEEWFAGMTLGDIKAAFQYDESDLMERFAELTGQADPKAEPLKGSPDTSPPGSPSEANT